MLQGFPLPLLPSTIITPRPPGERSAVPRPLFDLEWLDLKPEATIEPDLPILDPHHHLWENREPPYGLAAFTADAMSGHDIRATVYIEALTQWYKHGPRHLRPVGETAFAATAGERALQSGGPHIAAGIVAHGQLTVGDAVQEALEAHAEAGRGRFRGVRANLFWDADIDLGIAMPAKDLCTTASFRAGFARLAPLGLSCDIFAFYPNLPEIARLAARFPSTPIVLDHCAGPLGCPPYASRPTEMFDEWRTQVRAIAAYENVCIKIGGLGASHFGPLMPLGLRKRPAPPGSRELAGLMRPFVEECVAAFGTRRCMFESNFPVDKHDYGYGVFWNALKRLTRDYSASEKSDLFSQTAGRFYRIATPWQQ
jgi:predicted TIM-barrel fold metal-dependent hydrolase